MSTSAITVICLALYTLVVFVIGIQASKKEGSEGYLISDRNRSGFQVGISISIGWVGGLFIAYYAETIKSYGWGPLGVWLVAVIIGYLLFDRIVPELKRYADEHSLFMLPGYFTKKYSKRSGFALLFCNLFIFFFWLVGQFVVGAQILSGFAGFEYGSAIFILAIITLPYLYLGGFRAVLSTDLFQMGLLFIIMGSLFFFQRTDLNLNLPEANTLFSMPINEFLSILILGPLWVVVSGDVWQRIYAASSVSEARKSLFWAVVSYTIITPLICFPFLLAISIPEAVMQEDFLSYALQSVFVPEMQPFIILALIISIMSTIDTAAFGATMSITNDILKPLNIIAPEKLMFWTKRLLIVVIVSAALAAFYYPSVVSLVYAMMGLAACMAPAILASFFKKPVMGEPALFYSVVTSITTYLFIQLSGQNSLFYQLLPVIVGTLIIPISHLIFARSEYE